MQSRPAKQAPKPSRSRAALPSAGPGAGWRLPGERRFLTPRNVLIGLVLLAGGLLGPLTSRIVAQMRATPITAAFASRTPTVTASATAQPASPTLGASPTAAPASPTAGAPPSPTPTATDTPTAAPAPTATSIPIPEGMALIPAGYFLMGSTLGPVSEAPEHPVLLDPFYLDRYEVSNGDYQACVAAGACAPARIASSFTRQAYRDDPAFAAYPVIGVTWDDAAGYCRWAGSRLPTEAEWEYAASGPENYTWPWGNAFEVGRSAAGARDTQPVDAYPDGASPFGIYNLAGNVEEWVADVYVVNFYAVSPPRNPVGEGSGYFRLYRGGSYGSDDRLEYSTSRRSLKARNFSTIDLGFRCARSAPDEAQRAPPEAQQALVNEFCGLYAAYRPGAPCP